MCSAMSEMFSGQAPEKSPEIMSEGGLEGGRKKENIALHRRRKGPIQRMSKEN